jgi:hypothetical protein
MSMKQTGAFASRELMKSSRTTAVDPWCSIQVFDDESIPLQSFANFADFVQDRDDTSKPI